MMSDAHTKMNKPSTKYIFYTLLRLGLLLCAIWIIYKIFNPLDQFSSHTGVEVAHVFGNVINGSAYDKAVLLPAASDMFVFPDDAIIETTHEGSEIEIFIKKTLSYHGHPPGSITVLDAREAMGVSHRIDDKQFILATYGEWDSRIEGGASIRLLLRIPQEMSYTTRQGLSGSDSEACGGFGMFHTEDHVNWYVDAKPLDGWTAIQTEADRAMTLKDYVKN